MVVLVWGGEIMAVKQMKRHTDALAALEGIAGSIYDQLASERIPEMAIPLRTKTNIRFDEAHRVWRYGDSMGTRTAKKLDGAYMLLRTMYLVDFIREMLKQSKSSTLRELYYISESWDLGKFNAQDESDKLIEDMEIVTTSMREDFRLRPEEDGAKVLGDFTLTEVNRKGIPKKINCRDDVGDTGYGIPYNVEPEKITFNDFGSSKFILAIETGGMFDRLVENGFDETHNAVLVHIKGQPARSTRRFIKRLSNESKLPVAVFLDGDPWSYRIYASLAYGAIKTAHISHYLATPHAEYLGVTPSDIVNYELPSDKLNDRDKDALKAELQDLRFGNDFWQNEIKLQLKLGKKSEQQALAKYGLDFVTNTYLPEKLSEMGYIN